MKLLTVVVVATLVLACVAQEAKKSKGKKMPLPIPKGKAMAKGLKKDKKMPLPIPKGKAVAKGLKKENFENAKKVKAVPHEKVCMDHFRDARKMYFTATVTTYNNMCRVSCLI